MSKWDIRNRRRRRGQPLTTTIPKSGSLFLLGPGRVPRTEGQISQNLRVRAVASFRDNGTTLMGENKQDTSKKGEKLITFFTMLVFRHRNKESNKEVEPMSDSKPNTIDGSMNNFDTKNFEGG